MKFISCVFKFFCSKSFFGAAAVAASTAGLMYNYKHLYTQSWFSVGAVHELIIYPLDGGQGTSISEALCTTMGLETINEKESNEILKDRSFMIYSRVTRTVVNVIDELSIVKMSYFRNRIQLSVPDKPILEISIPNCIHNPVKVKYWDDEIVLYDCGDEVQEWLANILNQYYLRMGFHTGINRRLFRKLTDDPLRNKINKMRPDLSPYIFLSADSINEINLRAEKCFTGEDYRAHIIIKFDSNCPFRETKFKKIKINDVVFEDSRLIVPTHCIRRNYKTGQRTEDSPYFNIFRRLCKLGYYDSDFLETNEITIGIGMECVENGSIKVSDEIFAML